MNQAIITEYQNNITLSEQQIKYYQRKSNVFSAMRLAAFGCLLVVIYWAVKLDAIWLFAAGAVVIGVVFNWLVSRQARFDEQRTYYQNFKAVNQNEVDSIATHANLYANGNAFNNEKHYYTSDLDIFGPATLFQLVNRAATLSGQEKLADWLKAPASREVILSRQQALQEIQQKNAWKLDTQARLLFAHKQDVNELAQLFRYLHKPLQLSGEAWLSKYVMLAPVLFIGAFVSSFYWTGGKFMVAGIALLHIIITNLFSKKTQQTDLIAGKIGHTLQSYAGIFNSIEQEDWSSGYLVNLANAVKHPNGKSTSAIIKQLSALITNLNARLVMILGSILNIVFVWDVRYVIAIENWKRANHQNIEASFDVIADFEALMSLASLHINNPHWCMPQIAEGNNYTLTATSIAHPLIKEQVRVENDYELTDTRKVDIITGSNMAGKSTFLRTLGINTVLALAGAPVCATSMQVSVVQLFSYMRIKDSLNESTSTFKAELDRLQMLLQAVENHPNIFFLIDEMLRGTNSVDKYRGSKAVIERLISQNGVGLVATHDLQLAELEKQYPHYVRNFYFDIQVIDGEMLFDYKMKPGECKTFNASLLLERIGIKSPPAP
jgi:DNA mismatch repair ATPase MutS